MIGVGKLDKRIKLKFRTLVDDGLTEKEGFAVDRSVWANVSWVRDSERFAATAIQKDIVLRLIIRKTNIDSTWRIEVDDREFSIEGIKPIDKQFMEITAGGVNVSQA